MSESAENTELAQLAASGLFDEAWYLARNDDVRAAGLNPLEHFYRYGWREGRWPNRHLDPAWYLDRYQDIRAANMNPLLHYLRHGDGEGRMPTEHFDPNWYRLVYDLPADTVALAHFLAHRTTGRFAPSRELYAVPYLAPYCDDPAAGVDPFGHYLDDCIRDQSDAFPDLPIVAASGLVDPNYYLINGSDVHEAAVDPVEHFCRYGWREMRKPNIYFDTGWYLHTNRDVVRLGVNPLLHYIVQGEAANRRPVPYFDPGWYRSRYQLDAGQTALAHFLRHRRSQQYSPTPLFDVAWYVRQHAEELGRNRDPFAHFLQVGTFRDVDPSPGFSASMYRNRHLGRPSRHFRNLMHPEKDNPLIHHLRTEYR